MDGALTLTLPLTITHTLTITPNLTTIIHHRLPVRLVPALPVRPRQHHANQRRAVQDRVSVQQGLLRQAHRLTLNLTLNLTLTLALTLILTVTLTPTLTLTLGVHLFLGVFFILIGLCIAVLLPAQLEKEHCRGRHTHPLP